MAQPAGFTQNLLSIDSFWERASVEPPLECSKWAAIVEKTVFAKDGIEIRNILHDKLELVDLTEPVFEVEITGKTEAQRKNRKIRNQEKPVGWENRCLKARENGVLGNSVPWDEADAKVRSYLFLCLDTEGQRQVQQKRSGLKIQSSRTKALMRVLEDIFITQSLHLTETNLFAVNRKKIIVRKNPR